MSNAEIKTEIIQYLDKVKDESFLKVVHSMLNTYLQQQEDPIIGYDTEGNAVRASEARRQFEEDLEGVKQGQYTTLEDFEM